MFVLILVLALALALSLALVLAPASASAPAPALAPIPLLALAVLPDAALVTLLLPVPNVVLVIVVRSIFELAWSVVLTSLLSTSTLLVSTGMSPWHGRVAVNDELTRMRNQGFYQLCRHVM